AACQILMLFGSSFIACPNITFAFSTVCNRAASSHTSSLFGHSSAPFIICVLAAPIFPASSSNRAAAIHPGACFGFVTVTLFNNFRTR
ncbi:hypothetical protein AX774_g6783, partial [Zancudomyces culisetae]